MEHCTEATKQIVNKYNLSKGKLPKLYNYDPHYFLKFTILINIYIYFLNCYFSYS